MVFNSGERSWKFSPAFSALNRDSAVSLVAVVMWLCKHLPLSSFPNLALLDAAEE